jgi:hypothetical protein
MISNTLDKFTKSLKLLSHELPNVMVVSASEFDSDELHDLDQLSIDVRDYILAKVTESKSGLPHPKLVTYIKLTGCKNYPSHGTTKELIEIIKHLLVDYTPARTRVTVTFNEETFKFPSMSWDVTNFRDINY